MLIILTEPRNDEDRGVKYFDDQAIAALKGLVVQAREVEHGYAVSPAALADAVDTAPHLEVDPKGIREYWCKWAVAHAGKEVTFDTREAQRVVAKALVTAA